MGQFGVQRSVGFEVAQNLNLVGFNVGNLEKLFKTGGRNFVASS